MDRAGPAAGNEQSRWALTSSSPEETEALGAALGRLLRAGQGLALGGPLGAGKTVFARGVAAGLGVDGAEEVVSPSYLLMVEYSGPIPLYHFDAYFAAKEREFLADGGEVLLEGAGVALVEWAERLGDQIPGHFLRVTLQLEPGGGDRRRILLEGDQAEWGAILSTLAGTFGR